MAEIYLDATNTIAGRLASYAAKQALLGHEVVILNSEHAIISGKATYTHEKYYKKAFDLGRPVKGPFISRSPDRFLRRIIRGMLPHKQSRGVEAFKRIMCYKGVPEIFKDKKTQKLQKSDFNKLPQLKYISVKELCAKLGGK